MSEKIEKTDAEWRATLTPEQYEVMRRKGTERAFTGAYWNCHDDGVYRCGSCGAELFDAGDKFESGSGWPSFTRAIAEGRVRTEVDHSHGMVRTEALCARCDAHLGHVFPDGPAPTGTRFCINSVSLDLARKADR
jgi:peptide-methionine (R)-S-oxide reductase